jgi:hypothetical protein
MSAAIRSSRLLGSFPRPVGRGWSMFGQDGGQSIDLGDGRVLFLFSDTLLAVQDPALLSHGAAPIPTRSPLGSAALFLPNCGAIAERQSTFVATLEAMRYLVDAAGVPRILLAAREREQFEQLRFWPEHGVRLGDAVYLYYLGIQTVDPSLSFGFRHAGTGLARLDLNTMVATRVTCRGEWRLWATSRDDLHVGVCVVPFEEWLYVYCAAREGVTTEAHLMRVPPDQIEDATAYEYLSSCEPTWSRDRQEAVSLGESATEYNVRFNAHFGKYMMSYVDAFTKSITVRFAEQPWGPFGPPEPLIKVPSPPEVPMVYLGFEHSLFEERQGARIYLSYSQPEFSMNASVQLTFA